MMFNSVAILNNERFLEKCEHSRQQLRPTGFKADCSHNNPGLVGLWDSWANTHQETVGQSSMLPMTRSCNRSRQSCPLDISFSQPLLFQQDAASAHLPLLELLKPYCSWFRPPLQ